MGTVWSPAELATSLARLQQALDDGQRDVVNAAASDVEDVFYDKAMAAIRGPSIGRKGRGGAGGPKKWGTRTYKASSNTNPAAIVAYKGDVHLVHNDTKDHSIVSRKVGGNLTSRGAFRTEPGMFGYARRRGAVMIGGQPYAYGRHPGTTGRPWFPDVMRAAPPVAAKRLRRGTGDALRRAGIWSDGSTWHGV